LDFAHDRDGDGYVEYQRATEQGLANQSSSRTATIMLTKGRAVVAVRERRPAGRLCEPLQQPDMRSYGSAR